MSNKRKREDDSLNTVEELRQRCAELREDDSLNTVEEFRQRCAELRCSNGVRYTAIKCNTMVIRQIKYILEMELIPDHKKVSLMRTLFVSLKSDVEKTRYKN